MIQKVTLIKKGNFSSHASAILKSISWVGSHESVQLWQHVSHICMMKGGYFRTSGWQKITVFESDMIWIAGSTMQDVDK